MNLLMDKFVYVETFKLDFKIYNSRKHAIRESREGIKLHLIHASPYNEFSLVHFLIHLLFSTVALF